MGGSLPVNRMQNPGEISGCFRGFDAHSRLGEDKTYFVPGGAVMAEGPCSGESGEALMKAENAAVEVYRFAALMLGNATEALRLVENTVASVEIDPCADPRAAKGLVRERVL